MTWILAQHRVLRQAYPVPWYPTAGTPAGREVCARQPLFRATVPSCALFFIEPLEKLCIRLCYFCIGRAAWLPRRDCSHCCDVCCHFFFTLTAAEGGVPVLRVMVPCALWNSRIMVYGSLCMATTAVVCICCV